MMQDAPSAVGVSRRSLMVLFFAVLSVGMGQTVVFAIIPMLGRELGLTELMINTLVASSAFVFFLTSPGWGRRSDQWGRKPVLITGLLGYCLGTLLFNQVASWGLQGLWGGMGLLLALIATRVCQSGIMSACHPAAIAYMVDVTPPLKRAKGVSRISAASGMGTMLGPGLAWFAVISFLAPLYLQAALTAIAALLVYYLLPESHHERATASKRTRLRYLDGRYRIYLLIGLLMYTLMGVVQQTLGYYFQDRLHLTGVQAAQYYSLAMMVSSACMLFSQLVLVQHWETHPDRLLLTGLPLAGLGYLLIAIAPGLTGLVMGMGLFGLGMGLAGPGYNAGASLTVSPQEQGSLAGLLAAAPGLGFVGGPLIGGMLYTWQPSAPYWCAGLAVLLLAVWGYRRGVGNLGA